MYKLGQTRFLLTNAAPVLETFNRNVYLARRSTKRLVFKYFLEKKLVYLVRFDFLWNYRSIVVSCGVPSRDSTRLFDTHCRRVGYCRRNMRSFVGVGSFRGVRPYCYGNATRVLCCRMNAASVWISTRMRLPRWKNMETPLRPSGSLIRLWWLFMKLLMKSQKRKRNVFTPYPGILLVDVKIKKTVRNANTTIVAKRLQRKSYRGCFKRARKFSKKKKSAVIIAFARFRCMYARLTIIYRRVDYRKRT